MSFRKRNVHIGTSSNDKPLPVQKQQHLPGTRPSPLDGRLTTSTGSASLDQLLTGHAGLPLGHSLLAEEHGTTDFSSILLRYYTAEGLVQGHHVHVLGASENWRRDLPGLEVAKASKAEPTAASTAANDPMRIAWRYQTLGNNSTKSTDPTAMAQAGSDTFCHSFHLGKRLDNAAVQGQLHSYPAASAAYGRGPSPLKRFLADVTKKIEGSAPTTVHRIVIPSILSPVVYAASACQPDELLQLFHGLRGLLRTYSSRLTAMASMPISLYPRTSGLTRWAELLFDGVIELAPLQQSLQTSPTDSKGTATQGMLRAHALPIFHEKGGGLEGSWTREDLSFKVSSSSGFVITPFSLPPLADEEEKPAAQEGAKKQESLEF